MKVTINIWIINVLLLASIILINFSCSRGEDEQREDTDIILNGHDYKVWEFRPHRDSIESEKIHFYFDNKGNYINMSIGNDRRFRVFSYGDFIVPKIWNIRNDTLSFEASKYKIIQHSLDTIWLHDFQHNDTMYLIDIGLPPKHSR